LLNHSIPAPITEVKPMQMNITFRHVNPIESLKTYAQEKVERVNKYLDTPSEAHVVLSVEKHHHQADITIHSGPYMLRGKERSQDMYASITWRWTRSSASSSATRSASRRSTGAIACTTARTCSTR